MTRVPVDERSRQIIAAARTVICRDGLAQATIRRIAEEAGAPLGTIHYTFRDKDELVALVYQHWNDVADERVEGLVAEGAGLEAGARALLTGIFDWVAGEDEFSMAEYELFFWALRQPSARHLATELYTRFLTTCEAALQRAAGGNADPVAVHNLACFIQCALDGMIIKFFALGDLELVRADLNQFADAAAIMVRMSAAPEPA